ncbi:G/U mismatch-specific DNA glycosylase [Burkholderia diffusa]|uniref:DNA glycosylase n=1 Tax=Burkholderia diffusa TaxID=488732 RepID=A0A6P2GXZ5_9BURK|nr:G/U mismatch-specific DNA glycosylase [Burkholderia diffusa]KAB0645653.1 G/U mismatch-specific DNA glycosylase [Burkholderia diffusa]MBM2651055.1 G/U mismatch-specific DNA glycosylase [Burkholderia diffusa]VWB08489.1 DNA glycosylase [Burkholderia diffusa]
MADALPDLIAPRLDVLFCGINPGMTAAATGHHFAGRNNRFWRVLHLAGFTPDEIAPRDDRTILAYGCGLTAVVPRPTASADQLSHAEFVAEVAVLEQKIVHYAPRFVAFLGKAAYAALSGRREITWGRQAEHMQRATVWILPNPSGRNRAFGIDDLVDAYRELREAAQAVSGRRQKGTSDAEQ